jgi:hypothetical protein
MKEGGSFCGASTFSSMKNSADVLAKMLPFFCYALHFAALNAPHKA